MDTTDSSPRPPPLFGRRRVAVAFIASGAWGLLFTMAYTLPFWQVMARFMLVGLLAMLVFGLFERWPRRLPRWLARWVLQVVGVALTMPLGAFILYSILFSWDSVPFWQVGDRLFGFAIMAVTGTLFAPWVALAALLRQSHSLIQSQAQAFQYERSELERKALDARLRLLQAQVEPHFLFNTLANVRELVDAGSEQATAVLDHLIAYLRAAVPRLQAPASTLGEELQLVRAYLELMRMRMPDRLDFTLHADDAALALHCPPTTLLTLVENAVRHGIDPSETGGSIELVANVDQNRCRVRVRDTGVGLQATGNGLGTGLTTLRERLRLVFSGDVRLDLTPVAPHGVLAELDFPARPLSA
jgi:signal transduction histidine kinase